MKPTVKVARALVTQATPAIGVISSKIELNLARDEAAELLSVHTHFSFSAVNLGMVTGLYRKSDNMETAVNVESVAVRDKDWVLMEEESTGNAAYTGVLVKNHFYHMPANLLLIRSPRAVMYQAQATAMHIMMTLYYKIIKISKDDLARLMVKYHS